MRLIIHIGTPKTGSTSIQKGLAKLRNSLHEQGCLYPGSSVSHHLVAALVRPFNKLRRYTRAKFKNNPEKLFQRAEVLREKIRNSDVDTVLISSEFLCRFESEEIARLVEVLGFEVQDVYAICYVRQPSKYFVSGIQQVLKASTTFPNPFVSKYDFQRMLQSWGSVIGKDNVIVRPFDREQLYKGDVLSDVLHVLAEQFGIDLLKQKIPDMNVNTTLPAEACILMQELRKELLDLDDNVYTEDSKRLVKIIKNKSRGMGLSRMKFREEIVSPIDSIHSAELEWLKKSYGIEFTGSNTAATYEEMKLAQKIFSSGQIRDLLCGYDKVKLEGLRRKVVSSYKRRSQLVLLYSRFVGMLTNR